MKKLVSLLCALLMFTMLLSGCGGQTGGQAEGDGAKPSAGAQTPAEDGGKDVRVVKCGYPDPAGPNSHYSYYLDYFNERLGELSGGTIYFEGYPDGQLGTETDMLNAMSDGSLEAACISVDTYSSQVPDLQLFSLPFIFNYPEQHTVLSDNEEFMGHFKKIFSDSWNIVFLAGAINGGNRNLLADREINSMEDLKDLPIRVTTSQILQKNWEALNATPTVVAFSELYTAMSQGVVNAAEVPIETFVFKGIYEIGKSVAIVDMDSCIGFPMMSKTAFESFTEEEQGWILQAAGEAVAYQREHLPVSEQECLDIMANEKGITVTRPDTQPMKEATRCVHEEYQDIISKDILQMAYRLLDEDNAAKNYQCWSDIFPDYMNS